MLAVAGAGGRAVWYLTRATGVVALVVLTASVVLGVLETKGWRTEGWPRFVTAGLHRSISLLSVAFIAVHVITTVVDGFAPIGWLDVIVPFRSPYRPVWLGLGAVAVDLLLAVVVTSLVRQRIGYRTWRVVHWASYACWPVALVHGLGMGTDTKIGWVLLLNVVALGAVVAAVGWRLADGWRSQRTRPGVALATSMASGLVSVAIVAFALLGPLRSGWARRAGTPAALLGSARVATTSGSAAPPAAGASQQPAPSGPAVTFSSPFADSFSATLAQSGPDASGSETIVIEGALTGSAPGRLRITLRGLPVGGGGVQMTSGAVTMGPASAPSAWTGSVVSLQGTSMTLSVTGPDRRTALVAVGLRIDDAGGVTGSVQGQGPSRGDGGG